MAEDIKARVCRYPLRHVASVERINNAEERPESPASDTCLGWTEESYTVTRLRSDDIIK